METANFVSALCLCLFITTVSGVSTAAPGSEPSPPTTDIAPAATTEATKSGLCKGGFENQCVDCRNIAICGGGHDPLITRSCASLNPATPYCDNGVCTSSAPGASCEADFRCSSAGYFPHPESCSKYYLCNAANGSAHEYDCGVNQFYNAKEYTCQQKVTEADCRIVDCYRNPNAYVRHPGNPAYYAFCLNTAEHVEIILFKCPNERTSEFNLQTFQCDFNCPKEGRFPHGNCNKFYECFRSGNALEASEWACPDGFKYDKKEKRCMPGSCK